MKKIILLLSLTMSEFVFAQNLIVNIDNPSFRKLITAVPDFAPSSKADAEVHTLAQSGAAELRRLLTFSGLFNVLSESAYKDLMKKFSEKDFLATDMSGVSIPQWRTISAESLTLAHLAKEQGELTLTIRTIDISQGKSILGKRYSKIKSQDYIKVIRRYADQLLKAYTGKAGIFNTKLVFVGRKSASSPKQIYISDFDGSNVVQLTKENCPHLSPSWSRSGRFITYTSYEDGNPDLFLYDLTTHRKTKVSGRKGINSGANWAPDDRIIAFTGSNEDDTDIFVIKPEGGPRKLFIRGNGLDVDPTFSPDGTKLAYVSGRFGNPHLFVANVQWSGDTPKVTGDVRLTYAGWYNTSPSWTPESDRIAFGGYDKEIDRWDLFLVNPDGTKMERLTLKMGDNEHPAFSPNGQNILFESNRTNGENVKTVKQLYIMNRDGSAQRQLNTGLYEAQQPNWGPVGQE